MSHQMSLSLRVRLLPCLLALAAGGLPFALALSPAARPAAPVETPQQVADTLDGIVQPRFQQNQGRFGVDRIFFAGHDNVYRLSSMTALEKTQFRRVNAARRPYVIAFLHCAHKPGHDPLSKAGNGWTWQGPALQTLAEASSTSASMAKIFDWSVTHLEKAVLPDLPTLRRGTAVSRDSDNWHLVLRPVLASRASCLGCHAGAKRGDTLGVMVYAVDRTAPHAPLRYFNDGNF